MSNSTVDPSWSCHDMIGHGSFGHVFISGNSNYAVKIIKDLNVAINEISIMRFLQHPSILKLIDYRTNVINNVQYVELKLPYIKRTLEDVIGNKPCFSLERIIRISRQLLSALSYLHDFPRFIMHRDLKSNNILIDINSNDHVWLADFGAAQQYIPGKTYTAPITVYSYAAPETIMLHYRPNYGRALYTPLIDVFSFGCILWEMIFGQNSKFMGDIDNENDASAIHALCMMNPENVAKNIILSIPDKIIGKLLARTMAWDPATRFTAQEALSHIQKI